VAEISDSRPVLSVIIPTKNEARNVGHVLQRLPDCVDEVIIVDAGSNDGTVDVARAVRPDIKVVHQTRRGKGNALAAGFEATGGDYVVMMDADGSMDPAEIPLYVAALDFGAEYVKGSRFAVGGGSVDISPLRSLGNAVLLMLANTLFKARFTDLCYGMNGFRKDCISAFGLPGDVPGEPQWGDGFEIETILNIKAAKARFLIHEVPSFEAERLSGESNLRTFRDGTRVLVTIVREWLRAPMWRFSSVRPVTVNLAAGSDGARPAMQRQAPAYDVVEVKHRDGATL
jgi:glycosyltransferase involved in cell wall biosynthesis